MRPRSFLLAGLIALGGCSSDVNPVRDAFVATGVAPTVPKPQEFVARTRRGELDYRPVEAAPRPRAQRSKTAAEVSAVEAELDAVRTTNDRIGAEARAAGSSAGTPGN